MKGENRKETLRKRDERRELRRAREHPSYGRGDNEGLQDLSNIYLVYPHWLKNPDWGTDEKIHYTIDRPKGPGRRPPTMFPDEWEEVKKTKPQGSYRELRVAICGVKYERKNYVKLLVPGQSPDGRATCLRCLGSNLCPDEFATPEAKQKMQDKGGHNLG